MRTKAERRALHTSSLRTRKTFSNSPNSVTLNKRIGDKFYRAEKAGGQETYIEIKTKREVIGGEE